MTTKRLETSGTASAGVHHVGKVIASRNCIFNPIHQENDVGSDAYIEFIISEEAIGCCIAAQIKSGESYIRGENFVIPSDKNHFEYWHSLNIPVVGIVYDPNTDSARWVDITDYLNKTPWQNGKSFTIPVPGANFFDSGHFEEFRKHFLAYRESYGDDAHFVQALADFSTLDDEQRCTAGAKSLFAFHRGRPEAWYYLVSCLRHFRDHPLLRRLIVTLCHIPGHPDIFWHKGNLTVEATRERAEVYIRTLLSRDDVVTLLEGIDGTGIDRGQIGQCVDAVVSIINDRDDLLESILGDVRIGERTRYWAALLLVSYLQRKQPSRCIDALSGSASTFSGDCRECLDGLLEGLRAGREIYLY